MTLSAISPEALAQVDAFLRRRIDELETENERLRQQLRDVRSRHEADPLFAEIKRVFPGIQPAHGRILVALYRSPSKSLAHEILWRVIETNSTRPDDVLKVQVCKLRRVVGKSAIIRIFGSGYALSAQMRTLLESLDKRAA